MNASKESVNAREFTPIYTNSCITSYQNLPLYAKRNNKKLLNLTGRLVNKNGESLNNYILEINNLFKSYITINDGNIGFLNIQNGF